MKRILLPVILLIVAALNFEPAAQAQESKVKNEAVSLAPLSFYTNGFGSVHAFKLSQPVANGTLLPVGTIYSLVAVPAPGYRLVNWSPVNVFTASTVITNEDGSVSLISNITLSPQQPIRGGGYVLLKRLQPEQIIVESPLLEVTVYQGWQANFEPIGRR